MKTARALVLTGYGLNCDYETDHALKLAGAESHRVHINDLVKHREGWSGQRMSLDDFHILIIDGGFSWADDHGAGVILASKLRHGLPELSRYVEDGKLVMGICNGFQALVNLGLLPGFDGDYTERSVALTYNDCGNFRDQWVNLITRKSPCVFTRGMDIDGQVLELPVRHGEGKFHADEAIIRRLFDENQVVFRYATSDGEPARGQFPDNPNGALEDIAGICDPTGCILGLMPHPEAYNHFTNHPDWARTKEIGKRAALRQRDGSAGDGAVDDLDGASEEGQGIRIFRNAVEYVREELL